MKALRPHFVKAPTKAPSGITGVDEFTGWRDRLVACGGDATLGSIA